MRISGNISFLLRTVAAALMALLATAAGCSGDGSRVQKPLPPVVLPGDPEDPENPDDLEPSVVLRIVDADATPETKALLANLWKMQEEGKFMFGHHDGLLYGRAWSMVPGRSDAKDVCGEHPAVFSLDLGPITDGRPEMNGVPNEYLLNTIKEAYTRGEVIMAALIISNPHPEGGDFYDNSEAHTVWPGIITPGNAIHTRFLGWLDNLAAMANNLKDANGNLIPVIFRPFHEHTQEWPWWGTLRCTESQFIALWQMTVQYLRDTKGVHNFLYAISPQMDEMYGSPGTRDRLLFRWPGDDYVDFIGMDCYHWEYYDAFISNLTVLDALSHEKQKPCGVAETGKEGFSDSDYWTKRIVAPLQGRKVSMVSLWRNKYVGDINSTDRHFFSAYAGHPSEDDFRAMYNLPHVVFAGKLAGGILYRMPKGYVVKGN